MAKYFIFDATYFFVIENIKLIIGYVVQISDY